MQVAKNGLSFHCSVFYQATIEDSQLSTTMLDKQVSTRQGLQFGDLLLN
jgi:hypothetical protein